MLKVIFDRENEHRTMGFLAYPTFAGKRVYYMLLLPNHNKIALDNTMFICTTITIYNIHEYGWQWNLHE